MTTPKEIPLDVQLESAKITIGLLEDKIEKIESEDARKTKKIGRLESEIERKDKKIEGHDDLVADLKLAICDPEFLDTVRRLLKLRPSMTTDAAMNRLRRYINRGRKLQKRNILQKYREGAWL